MSEENVEWKGQRVIHSENDLENKAKNISENNDQRNVTEISDLRNITEENDQRDNRQTISGKLCEDGWESLKLKCYKHVSSREAITWDDAKDRCKSASNIGAGGISIADLASVHDEETNDLLKKLKPETAWIGG